MGLFLWLVVVAATLFLLVRWHSSSTVYHCAACGHDFVISTWTDLMAPHKPGAKLLTCPECGTRDWTEVLMAEAEEAGSELEGDAEAGAEGEE
jgi:DNA-directed RNA polymerase subunit RPC12/RpoP